MNQIKESGKLRIDGRIDKENMVYLCRETLLDHKEWVLSFAEKNVETGEHHFKWNEPVP